MVDPQNVRPPLPSPTHPVGQLSAAARRAEDDPAAFVLGGAASAARFRAADAAAAAGWLSALSPGWVRRARSHFRF